MARTNESNHGNLNLALLALDPLRFVKLCWPNMRLSKKQEQVLLSVRDNHETFVHAANQTGKTLIAAIIAIWFFVSRTPVRRNHLLVERNPIRKRPVVRDLPTDPECRLC